MVSTKNRRKESYNTNYSEGNKEVKISHLQNILKEKRNDYMRITWNGNKISELFKSYTYYFFFVEKLSDIKIGSASIYQRGNNMKRQKKCIENLKFTYSKLLKHNFRHRCTQLE